MEPIPAKGDQPGWAHSDLWRYDLSAASQGIPHMGARLTTNAFYSPSIAVIPQESVTKVCDNFQTSQCYADAFHLQSSGLSTVRI